MSTEPEAEPVSTPETETKALPGVLSEIRWWVRDIFFAVGTAILIVIFLYQPVKVEGTSMLPELRDQERIFVNKFVYRIERYQPQGHRGVLVSARPVEVLHQAHHRHAWRYGGNSSRRRLRQRTSFWTEPYVDSRFHGPSHVIRRFIVEPGHYYVLGDHRNQSNDSRMWGLVPEKYIYGKAVFRYWPVNKIGTLD